MKQVTITIQNAHRGASNGQTGTGGELVLIDKVFYALSPLLIKKGIVVYYDDAEVKNGAFTDYFLAIHFDGSTNPSYNGGFVDCSPTSATKDKDWEFARIIADYYFSAMGIRFAPEHRTANSTYYYAFNYTGWDTIQTIIECGTLTNPDDKAKCQDYEKIARLLCDGIVAYLTKYDKNYQEYLASIPAPTPTPTDPCKEEADRLRQELQKQTEVAKALQKEKDELASKLKECQLRSDTLLGLINKIKDLVNI